MKKIKRTLMISGILCLVAALLSVTSLLLDILYFEFSAFDVAMTSIELALSLATGITYLIMMNFEYEKLAKYNMIFTVFAISNIFNNLLVWIVAFWVEIAVNKYIRTKNFKDMLSGQNPIFKENNYESEIVLDDDDYTVVGKKETLESKLAELKELHEKNLITDEEYEKLRHDVIEKYI